MKLIANDHKLPNQNYRKPILCESWLDECLAIGNKCLEETLNLQWIKCSLHLCKAVWVSLWCHLCQQYKTTEIFELFFFFSLFSLMCLHNDWGTIHIICGTLWEQCEYQQKILKCEKESRQTVDQQGRMDKNLRRSCDREQRVCSQCVLVQEASEENEGEAWCDRVSLLGILI